LESFAFKAISGKGIAGPVALGTLVNPTLLNPSGACIMDAGLPDGQSLARVG
jgi:hypothetical protein